MLIFEYAWVFWLLPLPLLVWWLVPARSNRRAAVRVSFLSTLQAIIGSGTSGKLKKTRLWRGVLYVVAVL